MRAHGTRWIAGSKLIIALWATCSLIGCGYRPVASLGDGIDTSIFVPVFDSYLTIPELDVQAGSYLSTRLAARGLRVTSSESSSSISAQGILVQSREEPLMLQESSTVSELVVSARVDVANAEGVQCSTPTARGRAMLVASYEVLSEPDHQAALQEATEMAIERLLNDVILCVHEVRGSALSD